MATGRTRSTSIHHPYHSSFFELHFCRLLDYFAVQREKVSESKAGCWWALFGVNFASAFQVSDDHLVFSFENGWEVGNESKLMLQLCWEVSILVFVHSRANHPSMINFWPMFLCHTPIESALERPHTAVALVHRVCRLFAGRLPGRKSGALCDWPATWDRG